MNVFLLIIALLGFFMTAGLALYLVTIYQSEDDKGEALLPKGVVIVGLTLSVFTVLLLPFDVATRRDVTELDGHDAGIDLSFMWQTVFCLIVVWTLVVTPFATFYYESYEPGQKSNWSQARPAMIYTVGTCVVFLLLFIIFYFSLGYADLEYHGHTAPPMNVNLRTFTSTWDETNCFCHVKSTAQTGEIAADPAYCMMNGNDKRRNVFTDGERGCKLTTGDMSVGVTPFVYVIGLLSTIGWLTFVVFGGVGIIALPIDLINDWRNRPVKLSRTEYNEKKEELGKELSDLHEEGRKLADKAEAGDKGWFNSTQKNINKWQEKVTELETKWEYLQSSMDVERQVLLSYLKLPIGVLGVLLSFLWILHMFIHNIGNASAFLSGFFAGLDSFFPVFGVIVYAAFAMWMLWAAVKGCFKLGCNFGIVKIHPMKLGDTCMSSFLFNTLIVLITSVTVCQFCALSFRDYAANTVIDNLLNTYVVRLRGVGFIMRYFQTVMLIFSGLTALYLAFKCRRRS